MNIKNKDNKRILEISDKICSFLLGKVTYKLYATLPCASLNKGYL